MKAAYEQFRTNIHRARDLQATFVALSAQTTSALDLSDGLRAVLVLAVSALDHFVHEIVRKGMLEICLGTRPETPAFMRFEVSIKNVRQGIASPKTADWLEREVREQHSWLSFQDPKKIADAIRLISDKPLWIEVGKRMGEDDSSIKDTLKLIVDRRNKIAHEADMDPTVPGARWPIDGAMVKEAVDFIENVANAILDVVSGSA